MRLSSGQPKLCCTRPGRCCVRRHLPQLLEADAEFLRLAALVEAETLQQDLAQAAARAFGKQRVLGAQLHAAGEAVLAMAVLGDAHVAGGDAGDRAVGVEQHLGSGKAGIDLDPERFRLARKPATNVAERDDVVAVVAHQRRHQRHSAGAPRATAESQ